MEPFSHLLHDATRDEPPDRLERALLRGIITRDQYDAILALDEPADGRAAVEAPRGLNWISVAYALGALIVLFALGWFLIERWRELGAGGVLATTGAYALLFGGASWWLRRAGFLTAGGIAAVLAVSMVPLITWSVLELGGLWPDRPPSLPYFDRPPRLHVRWLLMEIATIVAALLTLRHVRYAGLVAPIAGALWFLSVHLTEAVVDTAMLRVIGPHVGFIFAAAMFAAGYAVDRRDTEREDYAAWLYLAGMVALTIALAERWQQLGVGRHALPLVAIALVAASLYLRRRIFLLAGSAYLLYYLGYLAFEVFRRTIAFPVVLAAFGSVVILGAVWVQKRYPALVERVRRQRAGQVALPGGYATALAPLAVAIVLLVAAIPGATREAARLRAEWREAERRAAEIGPPPRR